MSGQRSSPRQPAARLLRPEVAKLHDSRTPGNTAAEKEPSQAVVVSGAILGETASPSTDWPLRPAAGPTCPLVRPGDRGDIRSPERAYPPERQIEDARDHSGTREAQIDAVRRMRERSGEQA